ncbi:unnamed protein product [Protopolystoma xenopodis]|uniref:Uncharacterized protein n=1 Tax=Protopolystoma xenopodis TaxID=117903 RepID=A0A448WZY4_9PLAT|nr:unnamed protein product [Protopolystoma xenopodis]
MQLFGSPSLLAIICNCLRLRSRRRKLCREADETSSLERLSAHLTEKMLLVERSPLSLATHARQQVRAHLRPCRLAAPPVTFALTCYCLHVFDPVIDEIRGRHDS